MNRTISLFIALVWAGHSFGVDLSQYPFASEIHPADYASLSPADLARVKKIHTNEVRFLFVSSCDPAETRKDLCLWAFVNPLFVSKWALQTEDGGKTLTLHALRTGDGFELDETKERQFVSVLSLGKTPKADALQGIKVNGKSTVVTHWVKMAGRQGPPVPMLWLPVTPENQERINADYYEALRTNPKREVKFLFGDLQAEPASPGEAFFVVLGFGVTELKGDNLYFVARKHPNEADVFTSVLKRVRITDGVPVEFDWMGFTIPSEDDQPVELESILLEAPEKPALRGEIVKVPS